MRAGEKYVSTSMKPCGEEVEGSLREPSPSGTVNADCLLDLSMAAVIWIGDGYRAVKVDSCGASTSD